MDIALDKAVGDALNQTRLLPVTHLWLADRGIALY
jgi:hypothetical protein